MAIEAPPLDDADLIRLGAGHFHSGCAFCHGAPGMPVSPIARHMLPPPPDLSTSMRAMDRRGAVLDRQARHQVHGHAGWVAQERDDEVWAVVAFLRSIQRLDAATYRELALGSVKIAGQSGRSSRPSDSNQRGGGRLRALPWRGGRRAGERARAGPARAARRVPGRGAEGLCGGNARAAASCSRWRPISTPQEMRAARRLLRATCRRLSTKPRVDDAQLFERGRQLAEEGDAAQRHSGLQCLPRRRRACRAIRALPARTRATWRPAAPLATRVITLARPAQPSWRRSPAAERRQISQPSRPISQAFAPKRAGGGAEMISLARLALVLSAGAASAACGDRQSVLNPKGPDASRSRSWPGCCSRLATAILPWWSSRRWLAIHGPDRSRAFLAIRPHGRCGRRRVSGRDPHAAAELRPVADARQRHRAR